MIRWNEQITNPSVLLINIQGTKVGEVSIEEALRQAVAGDLDLAEVNPRADPPICKLVRRTLRVQIQDRQMELLEQQKKLRTELRHKLYNAQVDGLERAARLLDKRGHPDLAIDVRKLSLELA